tara:strand:+ start:1142 stop:1726 length:585 start_codon:yes stop_codon:yes gene_type:complete
MIISNEFNWLPPMVNPLDSHQEHKKTLSDLIDRFENDYDTLLTPDQANLDCEELPPILSSDYFVNNEIPRAWRDHFYAEVIQPLVFDTGVQLGLMPFEYFVHDAWFQRYLETAEHSWHTHTGCQFSNVYFLELPDGEYVTEIKGPNGKLIEYSAKEGDVITFPSWMLHRSKPNGKQRKTIISFNTSFNHNDAYK